MKTALMVIAPELFRDEEYVEPKIVLEDAKIRLKTTSVHGGPCFGKNGAVAVAEASLTEIDSDDYDAVIFVGGPGASVFFDDPLAHALARKLHDRDKPVAAICIAPSTLAHAGLLDGKRATAFSSQEADLVAHGAIFTGAEVEIDGRIITANGPEAATAFGEAIRDMILEAN